MKKNRKIIYLSLLVTFGIVLHAVENTIPFPFPFPVPGAKLGLANIISLVTLVIYGLSEGLAVNVLRCIIGSLITGSVSALLYSLSGAVTSTLLMLIAYKYFGNTFSLIGISVLGGVAHHITQVLVASLFLSTWGLFIYVPFLMIVGLITGVFTGIAATFVKRHLVAIIERPNIA